MNETSTALHLEQDLEVPRERYFAHDDDDKRNTYKAVSSTTEHLSAKRTDTSGFKKWTILKFKI